MIRQRLAAISVICVGALHGQSAIRFNYSPTLETVEPSRTGEVVFRIDSSVRSWSLGVHFSNEQGQGVACASVEKVSSGKRITPYIPGAVRPIPIRVEAGVISVAGDAGPHPVVCYLRSPSPVRLRAVSGGQDLYRGRIAEDSYIAQDGTVRQSPIISPGAAVMQLFLPGPPSLPAASLRRIKDGTILANPAVLRAHLASAALLTPPPGSTHTQTAGITARLRISTDGTVEDAILVGASDQTVAADLARQLRLWKFRPFIFEGNAVSVQASFPVSISPRAVRTPVL